MGIIGYCDAPRMARETAMVSDGSDGAGAFLILVAGLLALTEAILAAPGSLKLGGAGRSGWSVPLACPWDWLAILSPSRERLEGLLHT